MPELKTVKDSCVEMMEIVFPNDANPLGNIFGGRVMQLIDIVGSISAMRHARNTVVTVSNGPGGFQKSCVCGRSTYFECVCELSQTSQRN